jgi:cytochrome c-type biogenesis protein CcmH/NrfG
LATRLTVLVAIAAALAVVAGLTNYSYWRRVSSRASRPAQPPLANVPQRLAPDRPGQIVTLAQHLARQPQDTPARFQLAELYFKVQDYPRSMAELRVLERLRPKDSEVFLHQAVVLKYDGKPALAEKAVRRALALKPQHLRAREWLGEIYLDQQRYHQALEVFRQCLKSQPDSYFALLGKGRALEQLLLSRHPIPVSDVVQPVEKAVRLNPNHPEGVTTLARMKFAYLEGSEEAERLALRAVELDPSNARPHLILAQIYLSRPPTPENLRRVGEYAYEAGRRDLQDPRPPYLLGRVFLQQNDVGRAIKALERSLVLGPMPEAVSQLSVAYRRAGSEERASHYAEVYQRYADLMARRNALLGAREREPREVRHTYALAELYLEARQPDTAAFWLKEAQLLRKRDPVYDRLMTQVRQQRKEGRDAPTLPIP